MLILFVLSLLTFMGWSAYIIGALHTYNGGRCRNCLDGRYVVSEKGMYDHTGYKIPGATIRCPYCGDEHCLLPYVLVEGINGYSKLMMVWKLLAIFTLVSLCLTFRI